MSMTAISLTPADIERFWTKVDRSNPDGCWPWTSAVDTQGYGMFRAGGRSISASHIAMTLDGRPRPDAPNNRCLRASDCTCKACVAPHHRRWGSDLDGAADRMRHVRASPSYVPENEAGKAYRAKYMRQYRRRKPGRERPVAATLTI